MSHSKIKAFLDEKKYKYSEKDGALHVTLSSGQKIILERNPSGEYTITDRLPAWNFLTGFISSSLGPAMIYNIVFILGVAAGLIVLNRSLPTLDLTFILVLYGLFVLVVLISFYRYSKAKKAFHTDLTSAFK